MACAVRSGAPLGDRCSINEHVQCKFQLGLVSQSEMISTNKTVHFVLLRKSGCRSLVFHKTRPTLKSQVIVESQSEMILDEQEFVRELTENNLEAV